MRAVAVDVVAVAVASGCTNTTCLHGLCHDLDEERHFRGPCVGLGAGHPVAFLYGDASEQVTIGDREGYKGEYYTIHTGYQLAADGEVVSVYRNETWPATSYGFRPDGAIIERVVNGHIRVAEYDPALFQLAPAVGVERMAPSAAMGLVKSITYAGGGMVSEVTYTWAPTPTGWRRTSSTGEIAEVEVDDLGRVIAHDGLRYVFDGDRLVEKHAGAAVTRYTYDRGGNVVAAAHADGTEVAYSYHCWE